MIKKGKKNTKLLIAICVIDCNPTIATIVENTIMETEDKINDKKEDEGIA